AQSPRTTRRSPKPRDTNQSGNSKSSWTGGKQKLALLPAGKRALREPAQPHMSLARQCDLVGWPRSSCDYRPQGESAEHLHLLRLLDEPDTVTPYYGVRRMAAWLRRQGYHVHHNRVARWRQTMGREAIYPKPRLSQTQPMPRVSPSLLRGVPITHVHHVCGTDIPGSRPPGGVCV